MSTKIFCHCKGKDKSLLCLLFRKISYDLKNFTCSFFLDFVVLLLDRYALSLSKLQKLVLIIYLMTA